jgi:HAD superfamily hydrolase (TIGR01509 family)
MSCAKLSRPSSRRSVDKRSIFIINPVTLLFPLEEEKVIDPAAGVKEFFVEKSSTRHKTIAAVLFDYGGVLAEEGFREGLFAIGRKNGLEPGAFFTIVDDLIYETGYLIGRSDEAVFWDRVRKRTGILGSDSDLRKEILGRFVLRPDMIASVDRLRSRGLIVALLSDQTNWLEEIDHQTGLFGHFDRIFNSYRIHMSKREASVFKDVCTDLGVDPEETLFVDDNIGHIKRAQGQGLQTMHFVSVEDYEEQIRLMKIFDIENMDGSSTKRLRKNPSKF